MTFEIVHTPTFASRLLTIPSEHSDQVLGKDGTLRDDPDYALEQRERELRKLFVGMKRAMRALLVRLFDQTSPTDCAAHDPPMWNTGVADG